MSKSNPFSTLIAETALGIKAIELRPEDPFTWASGTKNPIYNDNRRLLAQYRHRMMVRDAILHYIKEHNLYAPYICGTSLSGIAPAHSVVEGLEAIGRPAKLMILNEKQLYIDTRFGSVIPHDINVDAICSTAPWAIPLGVTLANKNQLPYMYIRPERKKHGQNKLIEGMPKKGDHVFLALDSQNIEEVAELLYEEEKITCYRSPEYLDDRRWIKANHPNLKQYDMAKKKVVVIEDLISTGGSALKEVTACREAGAEVLGVISIFDYGLPTAKQAFADANCPVYSVLTYDKLLSVAKKNNMFDAAQLDLLADWKKDQPNWGTKNGFPAAAKA